MVGKKIAEMQEKLPGCAARSQQTGKSSWKMNHCGLLFAKHRLFRLCSICVSSIRNGEPRWSTSTTHNT